MTVTVTCESTLLDTEGTPLAQCELPARHKGVQHEATAILDTEEEAMNDQQVSVTLHWWTDSVRWVIPTTAREVDDDPGGTLISHAMVKNWEDGG